MTCWLPGALTDRHRAIARAHYYAQLEAEREASGEAAHDRRNSRHMLIAMMGLCA